jgi:hypothetical protein
MEKVNTHKVLLSLMLQHTPFSQESLPFPNTQSIEYHRSIPKPPLILLIHKATQGPHDPMKIGPLS